MVAEKIIKELNKGILYWYPFKAEAQVLCVGEKQEPILEMLREQQLQVTSVARIEDCGMEKYDYIIAIHAIENVKSPEGFMKACRERLHAEGKLLLAMDNRLGIRYFCGDRDPFTERNFDGIENYRRAGSGKQNEHEGRLWDKATVESALGISGFSMRQCFSVFPDIDTAQLLYAEDYLPEEALSIRCIPMYHYPDTVFLEEQYLYESLIKNGMFHQMANGYLFECSLGTELEDVKHITLSVDRGEQSAMATMIGGNGYVWKKAIYPQGIDSLRKLQENHEELSARGIHVVEGKLEKGCYVMPYMKADMAMIYLQELLKSDKDAFIAEIDRFREIILRSSEHVEPVLTEHEKREIIKDAEIHKGIWLKKGYFDLVPLNAFYIDGEYVFFDQEFYVEDYPANAIFVRAVDIVYSGHPDMEKILPRQYFWEKYDMVNQVNYLRWKSSDFLTHLRQQDKLRVYNEEHLQNTDVINSNRQRMNYPVGEYQRLFVDIFNHADDRKLFLFGSGNFAKKFVALYAKDYPVQAILDNNAQRWGQDLDGIPIVSADVLKELQPSEYKVIICIKNYIPVMKQLKELGVTEFSIYDTNMEYAGKKRQLQVKREDVTSEPKKYKVGYISGVFDLFHVGHLNMFKRAKEQCEYLIVGVVTDEGVRKNKKVEPFIPFEERIEMVRSCRYVDEAVEIPTNYANMKDAYRMHRFDVLFSGSDYENDQAWLMGKAFLEKHGADLVFFPYTEGTSSTKIKAMIERSLL